MKKFIAILLSIFSVMGLCICPIAANEVYPASQSTGVICHGVQPSLEVGETYSVRFIGSVESLQYYRVGFRITAQDGAYSWDKLASEVYTTLLGKTDTGLIEQYTAESLRGEGSYLYALEIRNIPTAGTVRFTVTPYAIKEWGHVPISGDSYDIVFTNGVFVSSAPSAFESMQFDTSGQTAYHLVYNADSENSATASEADAYASYLRTQCGLNIRAVSHTGSYQNEILLGDVSREAVSKLPLPSGEKVFAYGIVNGAYVINSDHRLGLAMGIQRLCDAILQDGAETVELSASQNLSGKLSELPQHPVYADAVTLAKSVYGTYSSWTELQLSKLNATQKADVALVKALIERMGGSAAFCVGSSSVLYDGYVVKADRSDYGMVTKLADNGHLLIAGSFAERYFGMSFSADAEGYVDLSEICSANADYTLSYDASLQIAVITPADEVGFGDSNASVGGYTNAEYLARMEQFFHNSYLPEPDAPVEQTRMEIVGNQYDPAYIYDYTDMTYECFASPDILEVTENGASVLYLSYSIDQMAFPNGANTTLSYNTKLLKSTDGGKSWQELAELTDVTYVKLIKLDGKILLMGMQKTMKVNGEGETVYPGYVWIGIYDPASGTLQSENLGLDVWGSAATSVTVHNGRIYRAHNYGVISADLNSNLLLKSSWTMTAKPASLISASDYLDAGMGEKQYNLQEGNVILKNGELYVLYRIDTSAYYGGHAAIFRLSDDGKTLTPLTKKETECGNGIIDFNGNQSMFQIQYDETTGLYLSLVSVTTRSSAHQRNVLKLIVSEDLIHWQEVGTMLVERQLMNQLESEYAHAFQYVSFELIGNDLIMVVREASGNACHYHNANAITMYTLTDYADYIRAHGFGN